MVDPRVKGATAETKVRDELRKSTGLKWERVPGSGALNEKHGLKGDLYVPNSTNYYCVEVKHYKDCHLTSNILTDKTPQLLEWWQQTIRESKQVSRKPLLIFKHDRSKLFAAYQEMPSADYRFMFINLPGHEFYVALLDDYLKYEQPKFVA